MRKFLSTLLFLSFTSISFAGDVTPINDYLNVRSEPSAASNVVRAVENGHQLKDLEEEFDNDGNIWIKVETEDLITGWVSKKYTKAYAENNLQAFTNKFLSNIPSVKIEKQVTHKNEKINNNITIVSGEGLHRVKISLKDMNRLTCPTRISDPIYSKDKELEVARGGEKDVFIKVSPVQTTYNGISELTYGDFPRELFVECSGVIYNFTLVPEEALPTQTIVIDSKLDEIKNVKQKEEATPYETLVSSLLKSAYNEVAPDSYTAEKGSITYKFQEMDMRLRYTYKGYNYIVEDWLITSKLENEIELEENIFVPIIKNARAIALTTPKLKKGESSRVLVVRLALENIE